MQNATRNRFPGVAQDALCDAGNGLGIDDQSRGGAKVVRGRTTRPAACQNTSTIFQRLPRRHNDLENLNAPIAGLNSLACKPCVKSVGRRTTPAQAPQNLGGQEAFPG